MTLIRIVKIPQRVLIYSSSTELSEAALRRNAMSRGERGGCLEGDLVAAPGDISGGD